MQSENNSRRDTERLDRIEQLLECQVQTGLSDERTLKEIRYQIVLRHRGQTNHRAAANQLIELAEEALEVSLRRSREYREQESRAFQSTSQLRDNSNEDNDHAEDQSRHSSYSFAERSHSKDIEPIEDGQEERKPESQQDYGKVESQMDSQQVKKTETTKYRNVF